MTICVKTGFSRDYDIIDDLGRGQFAVVKRVQAKNGDRDSLSEDLAAKIIRKRSVMESSSVGLGRKEIMREAEMLSRLCHHNIIALYDVYECEKSIILILELVPAGELFDYICENETLSEEDVAGFVLQILEGVHHIHTNGIIHLDLKPENIMLADRVKRNIKIIDFGISRWTKESHDYESNEIFGTPEFVAPEVVNFEPITTAADMWSIGVVTYILLSGASPFLGETNSETFLNITNVDYVFDDEFFPNTSDLAKDFIDGLFKREPEFRNDASWCLKHPWIQPRKNQEEDERRNGTVNMNNFKSFIARRRWKRSIRMVLLSNKIRRKSKGSIKRLSRGSIISHSLLLASASGNLNDLKELLDTRNINLDYTNELGQSAVHLVVLRDDISFLEFLYRHQANIDSQDVNGDTPLHYAVANDKPKCTQLLANNTSDINCTNNHGQTALHLAAKTQNVELISMLLLRNESIEIDCLDNSGNAPLHLAVLNETIHIAATLIANGASLDISNQNLETPLMVAASSPSPGASSIVKLLVENGSNVAMTDSKFMTALHRACEAGQVESASILISGGSNLASRDSLGRTPLHVSAMKGHGEISEMICELSTQEILDCKEHFRGRTALHIAAENSDIELAKILCRTKVDLNAKNKHGYTAKQIANGNRNRELVELLGFLEESETRRLVLIHQLSTQSSSPERIRLKIFGSSLRIGVLDAISRTNEAHSAPLSSIWRWKQSRKNESCELYSPNSIRVTDISNNLINLSIWSFGKIDERSFYYDNFVGDTNCIHAICYDVSLSLNQCFEYVKSHAEFIRVRMPVNILIGSEGRTAAGPALVLLIPINSDCCDHSRTAFVVKSKMRSFYVGGAEIEILDENVVLSTKPNSDETLYLLNLIKKHSPHIHQHFGRPSMLYDGILSEIDGNLHKDHHDFPRIMYSTSFANFVHTAVNPLAHERTHIGQTLKHLQLAGKLVYIEGDPLDVVCLDPDWLFERINLLLEGEDVIEDAVLEHAVTCLGIGCQFENAFFTPSLRFDGRRRNQSSKSRPTPADDRKFRPSIVLKPIDDPSSSVHAFLRLQIRAVFDFERVRFVQNRSVIEIDVDSSITARVAWRNQDEIAVWLCNDGGSNATRELMSVYVWQIMRKIAPRLLIDTIVEIDQNERYSINRAALTFSDEFYVEHQHRLVQQTEIGIDELCPLARMNLAKRLDNPVNDQLGRDFCALALASKLEERILCEISAFKPVEEDVIEPSKTLMVLESLTQSKPHENDEYRLTDLIQSLVDLDCTDIALVVLYSQQPSFNSTAISTNSSGSMDQID